MGVKEASRTGLWGKLAPRTDHNKKIIRIMDEIFYFFVLLTPIIVCYWILSFALVTVGARIGGGKGFLEFLRLWLKPLFWMNFIYFLAFEALVSIVYWAGYALVSASSVRTPWPFLNFVQKILSSIFAPLYDALFRAIGTGGSGGAGFAAWVFISLLLFVIIMIPYKIVHRRTTAFFKKLIFRDLCRSHGLPNGKFITQTPSNMLPSHLVRRIASSKDTAREWIISAFRENQLGFEGDPRKFHLGAHNADHMQWEIEGRVVDFWESNIYLLKRSPYRDEKEKLAYKRKYETCFDGVAIRINDVLPAGWSPDLYAIGEGPATGHRAQHKQGILLTLIEAILRGSGSHGSEQDSGLDQYPVAITELDVGKEHSLRFVGVDQKSLYMFLETGLEGTMFNFNMNTKIARSEALFLEDLQLVLHHYQMIDRVLASLDEQQRLKYKASA